MIVELEGFPVYAAKIEKAKEWMQFLKNHQAEVDQTLFAEHMQLEHIFSITINKQFYLCWYSNQTETGPNVAQSSNPIDQMHVKYWDKCIDTSKP
ncbi:DUF6176 family protein [Xylocopilactobacillus apicola]|uniref:L-rhamnose mutarotase n=1 Tax=Xylocopilactobacillus apicola TaxID=2932184 RepID=A0AAU9DAC0_9LACO|nr:DUF6176 family protein [Xylocopilactobacillus apicola]BDR57782.1 hypothetical protein XA3_02230 [Xylocopilactobacillus apicola]